MPRPRLRHLLALVAGTLFAGAAQAAGLPCQPCAGLHLDAPPAATLPAPSGGSPGAAATTPAADALGTPAGFDLLTYLRTARLAPGSPLFIAWDVVLAAPVGTAAARATPAGDSQSPTLAPPLAAAAAGATAVAAQGATPWLTLVFSAPAPLTQHLALLQQELAAAADLAAAAPRGTWFQVAWRPQAAAGGAAGTTAGAAGGPGHAAAAGASGGGFAAQDYGFLLKRAAVAISGAQDGLRVATEPLPADADAVGVLYAADVAPYVDLVVFAPAATSADAAIARVHELDAGKPIALDALPYPAEPAGGALAEAARQTTRGIELTFFRAPDAAAGGLSAAVLNPLVVLAREFAGDLSYDAGAAPVGGAAEAWAFVRGKDLALRVIVRAPSAPNTPSAPSAPSVPSAPSRPPATGGLTLRFADASLRRPTRFPLSGTAVAPPAARLLPPPDGGLEVKVADAAPVVVLGIERLSAAERQGVAEKVTVASQREMSVEEILKRLQVFEDAQSRRLESYIATDTTHLRFQPGAGTATVEATLTGPYFWRPGGGDWAWQTLYIDGVRWRAKTLPQIPLVEPEKAAAMPLAVQFTHDYRYRLRGTATIDGRDAWVVDFAPAAAEAKGGHLYQGTVWIDRTLYARLRTRAVQLGLKGEITSNEETLSYSPIDAMGQPAPWSADSFILPLNLLSEQIFTVLDNPMVVERETVLTGLRLNPGDFAAERKQVEDTDVTMVRETDQGLRYLVKKGPGEPRQVKEGTTPSQLFGVAGLFYDDSLSYPLPLGGINYFSFDFRHTGQQVNVFFAGPLLIASTSNPALAGTRFHLGGDAFAIAVPFTDDLYSKGREVVNQEVRILPATFDVKLGHPIGNFFHLGLQYGLAELIFSRNSNTAKQFTLPSDNLAQYLELDANYARAGYTVAGTYSYSIRSSWRPWGLPGNPDYSPADREFGRYGLSLAKNWYLAYFQKVSAELDYDDGTHLDRFSKYQFGFFGGTRIEGYRSNAVIATRAYLAHLSYGFDFGDIFRLNALADAALATDAETGLNNTLLAGTGLEGSLIGPWKTLITLNAGVPVAGPDHGFVLYLVFLKLFH